MVSLFGVLSAAALLIVPTCLWYAKAQTSFVQWGTITTSTMNTVQLVLLLLLAKDNPLWLPIAVLGREQVARVLELYGYEITRHIPVGDRWSMRVIFMEIHLSNYKTCLCMPCVCVCASAVVLRSCSMVSFNLGGVCQNTLWSCHQDYTCVLKQFARCLSSVDAHSYSKNTRHCKMLLLPKTRQVLLTKLDQMHDNSLRTCRGVMTSGSFKFASGLLR